MATAGTLPGARAGDRAAPEFVEVIPPSWPARPRRHGEVYLAQDTRLDRQVAIKFIAMLEPDAETLGRFLIEARAVARLTHPNVVGIYQGRRGRRASLLGL